MKKIVIILSILFSFSLEAYSQPLRMILMGQDAPPALLLDTYTSNVAAAYSLRKLKTGETAGVRVRRASDNTESDIGFDANNGFDVTGFTTFCASTQCYVTKFYDQNGTLDMVQATAINQPELKIQDGRYSIVFDGDGTSGQGDVLTTGAISTISQPLSYYTAVDQITYTGSDAIFSSGGAVTNSNPGPILEQGSPSGSVRLRETSTLSGSVSVSPFNGLNSWGLVSSEFYGFGNVYSLKINGTTPTTGSTMGVIGATAFNLGARWRSSPAPLMQNAGNVAIIEHVIFTSLVNYSIPTDINTYYGFY